jgi:hypothetical protein
LTGLSHFIKIKTYKKQPNLSILKIVQKKKTDKAIPALVLSNVVEER